MVKTRSGGAGNSESDASAMSAASSGVVSGAASGSGATTTPGLPRHGPPATARRETSTSSSAAAALLLREGPGPGGVGAAYRRPKTQAQRRPGERLPASTGASATATMSVGAIASGEESHADCGSGSATGSVVTSRLPHGLVRASPCKSLVRQISPSSARQGERVRPHPLEIAPPGVKANATARDDGAGSGGSAGPPGFSSMCSSANNMLSSSARRGRRQQRASLKPEEEESVSPSPRKRKDRQLKSMQKTAEIYGVPQAQPAAQRHVPPSRAGARAEARGGYGCPAPSLRHERDDVLCEGAEGLPAAVPALPVFLTHGTCGEASGQHHEEVRTLPSSSHEPFPPVVTDASDGYHPVPGSPLVPPSHLPAAQAEVEDAAAGMSTFETRALELARKMGGCARSDEGATFSATVRHWGGASPFGAHLFQGHGTGFPPLVPPQRAAVPSLEMGMASAASSAAAVHTTSSHRGMDSSLSCSESSNADSTQQQEATAVAGEHREQPGRRIKSSSPPRRWRRPGPLDLSAASVQQQPSSAPAEAPDAAAGHPFEGMDVAHRPFTPPKRRCGGPAPLGAPAEV